jgi:hypothetical protein
LNLKTEEKDKPGIARRKIASVCPSSNLRPQRIFPLASKVGATNFAPTRASLPFLQDGPRLSPQIVSFKA